MKRSLLTLLLATAFLIIKAQESAGYYSAASGKTGAVLKTALYGIISSHFDVGYGGLYEAYKKTDQKPDGTVWDMYSNCTYVIGSKQCGNYSKECDCFNREHTIPQSWFNSDKPMVSDMFHVYPTDGKVNGMRSNYPYGTVANPFTADKGTSGNGSKLGPCSFPGYTGTVFEPIDEYKGDLARGYFYMATCYENKIANWQSNGNANEVLNGTSFPCFDPWFINLLLTWNIADPVSQKEIKRNNAVYAIQKNRNPFIDHPEFVNMVWGTNTGIADENEQVALQVYPNPTSGNCTITLPPEFNQQNNTLVVYSSAGKAVKAPLTLTGDKATMNLENLPTGFYLVRLATNNYQTIYQARIIKN